MSLSVLFENIYVLFMQYFANYNSIFQRFSIIINKVHFPSSVLKMLVTNNKIKLHKHWWAENIIFRFERRDDRFFVHFTLHNVRFLSLNYLICNITSLK